MQTLLVFPTRHYAEKSVLRTLLYTIHSLNEELFVSLCKKSSCFYFKTEQCQQSCHLVRFRLCFAQTGNRSRSSIYLSLLFDRCYSFVWSFVRYLWVYVALGNSTRSSIGLQPLRESHAELVCLCMSIPIDINNPLKWVCGTKWGESLGCKFWIQKGMHLGSSIPGFCPEESGVLQA